MATTSSKRATILSRLEQEISANLATSKFVSHRILVLIADRLSTSFWAMSVAQGQADGDPTKRKVHKDRKLRSLWKRKKPIDEELDDLADFMKDAIKHAEAGIHMRTLE